MKKLVLLFLFIICACTDDASKLTQPQPAILTSTPAASVLQNWNELTENVFYDGKSIKTIRGITSTMLLINQPNETKAKSHLLKIEFDCHEHKMKIVIHAKHTEVMGSGKMISSASNVTGWLFTRPRPSDKPAASPPLLPLLEYMFLERLVCAIEKSKANIKNQPQKFSK